MIAVFKNDREVIVVGLELDGTVIDEDGTLFGPKSGRNQENYERMDMDPNAGQIVRVHIEATMRLW